jgi:hypothetical protein
LPGSKDHPAQRVRQDHAGCELAGEGDGLLAVGRGPDGSHAVDAGQRGDQAVAEKRVIAGGDDPQGVRGPVPVPQPWYLLVVAWALVPCSAGLGAAALR